MFLFVYPKNMEKRAAISTEAIQVLVSECIIGCFKTPVSWTVVGTKTTVLLNGKVPPVKLRNTRQV